MKKFLPAKLILFSYLLMYYRLEYPCISWYFHLVFIKAPPTLSLLNLRIWLFLLVSYISFVGVSREKDNHFLCLVEFGLHHAILHYRNDLWIL